MRVVRDWWIDIACFIAIVACIIGVIRSYLQAVSYP